MRRRPCWTTDHRKELFRKRKRCRSIVIMAHVAVTVALADVRGPRIACRPFCGRQKGKNSLRVWRHLCAVRRSRSADHDHDLLAIRTGWWVCPLLLYPLLPLSLSPVTVRLCRSPLTHCNTMAVYVLSFAYFRSIVLITDDREAFGNLIRSCSTIRSRLNSSSSERRTDTQALELQTLEAFLGMVYTMAVYV